MAPSTVASTSGWRRLEEIVAETGGHLHDDLGVSAPEALLHLFGGSDRRLHREVSRALEALQQLTALRRVVLIERRRREVFDVEGDAIAHGQHQDDRADSRKGESDRIAQQLDRFAAGIGPQPPEIETLGGRGLCLGLRGPVAAGSTLFDLSMPAASAR